MPCDHAPVFQQGVAHIVITSDPRAVREGLRALWETVLVQGLAGEDRGNAELVLAEALNNIVKHAYAGSHGDIRVMLARDGASLTCRIEDSGAPMPGGQLPAGLLADPGTLAEGGFGWHLIRTLTQDLSYRRTNGRNHLGFRLPLEQLPL